MHGIFWAKSTVRIVKGGYVWYTVTMKKRRNSCIPSVDTKSIRFVSWLAFLLFGIVIIAFLWLTQVVFLQVYVNNTKGRDFVNIALQLKRISYEDYKVDYDRIANQNAITVDVLVLDQTGKATVEYSSSGYRFGSSSNGSFNLKGVVAEIAETADATEGLYRRDDENKQLTYGVYIDDARTKLLVLSQSSELLDSTSRILMVQMVIATAIIIILSFGVSLMLSSALSQDLRILCDTAKQLSKDNYNVQFAEKGFTEARELAAALNYATAEMRKTDSLRRELVSNVSHDLRTPLTIIRGYAEMVRDLTGEDKEKREQQLNVIIKEADRLTALVNDLLELSKIQNQTEAPTIAPFDLSVTTRRALGSFELLSLRDGYTIDTWLDEGAVICGDERQIEQVVYNLVGNAINYTGADKRITVRVQCQQDIVRFAVTDTGEGLDDETRAHIWQRYYRAAEHKRSVVGTGLGLSIVQSVLDKHNADYGVDSQKGEGSTFWFALPLYRQ